MFFFLDSLKFILLPIFCFIFFFLLPASRHTRRDGAANDDSKGKRRLGRKRLDCPGFLGLHFLPFSPRFPNTRRSQLSTGRLLFNPSLHEPRLCAWTLRTSPIPIPKFNFEFRTNHTDCRTRLPRKNPDRTEPVGRPWRTNWSKGVPLRTIHQSAPDFHSQGPRSPRRQNSNSGEW